MLPEIATAKKYLLPPLQSFWKWQDDGDVITSRSGATIVFREELAAILEQLAPSGLPTLNTVLLVLAMMRDSNAVSFSALLSTMQPKHLTDPIASMLSHPNGFRKLTALPPELRSSIDAKANICKVIFEDFEPTVPSDDAGCVIQYLKHGIHEVLDDPKAFTPSHNRLSLADLHRLKTGLLAVSERSLTTRQRTSLDVLPQAAEIELPLGQHVRQIIDKLHDDTELQGLARLARQLMAALTLPRKLADPEEIPLGGVSDISNRGSLDRLLLTELVHDDLVLAARIGSNEAMYLRRESPPRDASREFSILLDSGIRMWGIPRVFATAVGLALIANADEHTRLNAFRSKGKQVEAADFLSREGLIHHLEVLEPHIHPGESLEAFAQKVSEGDNSQPIIVTTSDVLEDESFQQALAKISFPTMYIATAERSGDFCLIEKNERGRKVVCQIQIDLNRVLNNQTPKSKPLIDSASTAGLPAIFSVKPFPLLLSASSPQDQLAYLGDRGVLAFIKDGRLMHWHSQKHVGATELQSGLPPGKLIWQSYQRSANEIFALIHARSNDERYLIQVNLESGDCCVANIGIAGGWTPMAVQGGVLIAWMNGDFIAVDTRSGEIIQKQSWPYQMTQLNGRFCWTSQINAWYAASYTGSGIDLELVFGRDSLVHMFECDGVEGPVGITHDGNVYYTATGETWECLPPPARPPIKVMNVISHDCRAWITTKGAGSFVVDVKKRTRQMPPTGRWHDALHPEASKFITPTNMRHRLTHIAVEKAVGLPRLVLKTHKGTKLPLEIYPKGNHPPDRLILASRYVNDNSEMTQWQAFKPWNVPEAGFQLSRAAWNDGSEAILDSRGLLHLKSANTTIPEVTIALADGILGGWTSDGQLWGNPYFTDKGFDVSVHSKVLVQTIGGFIQEIV
ncbi:hypothetical protein GC197_00220 [bacterium]|nr:hypothetical protein [bacterium]